MQSCDLGKVSDEGLELKTEKRIMDKLRKPALFSVDEVFAFSKMTFPVFGERPRKI